MKLGEHKKTLIIIISFLILLGLIMVILLISKKNETPKTNPNENLIEVPNLPQSEWWRLIKTQEEKPGYQTAINNYGGYEITVPSEWGVEKKASSMGGLKIFSKPQKYDMSDPDISQGLILNIVTYDNSKKLSITDWLRQSSDASFFSGLKFKKTKIGQYAAFKTSMQLFNESLDKNKNIIEIPKIGRASCRERV